LFLLVILSEVEGPAVAFRCFVSGQGFNPDINPIHPFLKINPRDASRAQVFDIQSLR
jgi:hypothetical protein